MRPSVKSLKNKKLNQSLGVLLLFYKMTNKKSIYTALLCIANLLIIVLIIINFEINQKIVFKEKSKDGFSITPVEVCKFDVDENWKWCHKPESELLCKTNYPLQKKKSDLMFLLNQVTQFVF